MPWGLQNRLARIIRPADGHTVMLAADHGYFLGPTHKLEIPRKTLEPLLPFADAIMVTRGVVRTSIDPGANVPIVLRVSGGASVFRSAAVTAPPTKGTVTESGTMRFRYKPSAGLKGTDRYSIRICGSDRAGAGCSTITHVITLE